MCEIVSISRTVIYNAASSSETVIMCDIAPGSVLLNEILLGNLVMWHAAFGSASAGR
jgi:hypothetical protein